MLGYVRDCQLTAAKDVTIKIVQGLQLAEVRGSLYQHITHRQQDVRPEYHESAVNEMLEMRLQKVGLGELQGKDVKDTVGKCMEEDMQAAEEDKFSVGFYVVNK